MSTRTEFSSMTVRELRRRWKPNKERLAAEDPKSPTPIRFHRACSWIDRVETGTDDEDYDLAMIRLWIAFNSLYGQWDEEAREPMSDRKCWRDHVDRLLQLDLGGHISDTLLAHRPLVMSLLEDEYLSRYFWEEPCAKRAGQSKKAMYDARTWYLEERWGMILDRLLERIYLIRCQLVHGAATYGGKLNRTSLRRCVTMMHRLMPAFLLVWIDHGADEDWGAMCYPPLGSGRQPSPPKHQSRIPR